MRFARIHEGISKSEFHWEDRNIPVTSGSSVSTSENRNLLLLGASSSDVKGSRWGLRGEDYEQGNLGEEQGARKELHQDHGLSCPNKHVLRACNVTDVWWRQSQRQDLVSELFVPRVRKNLAPTHQEILLAHVWKVKRREGFRVGLCPWLLGHRPSVYWSCLQAAFPHGAKTVPVDTRIRKTDERGHRGSLLKAMTLFLRNTQQRSPCFSLVQTGCYSLDVICCPVFHGLGLVPSGGRKRW